MRQNSQGYSNFWDIGVRRDPRWPASITLPSPVAPDFTSDESGVQVAKLAGVVGDICNYCETECRKHEKKHSVCHECAEACAQCAKDCQKAAAAP